MNPVTKCCLWLATLVLVASLPADGVCRSAEPGTPPAVGDEAPDFELSTLDEKQVKLSKLTQAGPVVLVVLRGYPGYQCPLCTKQVGEFLGQAKKFQAAGANVVLVYPGPKRDLGQYAYAFIQGQAALPDHFHFVMDPDYTFTKAYRLRWDAPRETAYPSTFVIDRERKVRFAKASKTHGGRATAAEALKALEGA